MVGPEARRVAGVREARRGHSPGLVIAGEGCLSRQGPQAEVADPTDAGWGPVVGLFRRAPLRIDAAEAATLGFGPGALAGATLRTCALA
mmetsp:Transcript_23029/g.87058  ORF Transcript_23029/g.87058 Transcript_23029/m.87058 type:complete len:89 (-) Transcript_23029:1643-1909(-)